MLHLSRSGRDSSTVKARYLRNALDRLSTTNVLAGSAVGWSSMKSFDVRYRKNASTLQPPASGVA